MADSTQATAELGKLHAGFIEAFKSNDSAALGTFYTESAILLPPRRAAVLGRDPIVAFWTNAQRIQDIKFISTNVQALGDSAIREVGTLEFTIRGQGRATQNTAAKYMMLWVKVDGSWKLDTSIWNGLAGQGRQGGGQGGGGGGQGGRGQGGRGQGGRGQGGHGQGGRGQGGHGQGGHGQGGRGQGARGQGRGRPGGGGDRGSGSPGGSGFGRGADQLRANQNAPLVPRVD